MTETRTLQFESARAVQSLYANDLKLLKTLEDSLGVKVTTREGWVKLEGEPAQVGEGRARFRATGEGPATRRRHPQTRIQLRAQLRERSTRRNLEIWSRPRSSRSLARKPPIVARTLGQRKYVEAIQKHDIVFGIGPAGTGKTYLAVAMAVAALKKEQVDRIILTRPAVEAGEALGFLAGRSAGKDHALSAAALRRAARHARAGRDRALRGAADDRDRAARLHARPHA